MLETLKTMAARQVGKVLTSDATMKVLSSPQVQDALVKAVSLRAEAIEVVEQSVKGVAKSLELVTRDDVARLKRSIRDLEDHVEELRSQLAEAQAAQAAHAAEASHAAGEAEAAPKKKSPRSRKEA